MRAVTIHIGDVLDGLAKIPDGSVHCCVTSPPYWGLRDYGTATWEGGDAGCDHRQQLGGEGGTSAKQNTSAGTQMHQYRGRCKKCGAQRIDSQIGLEPTPDEFIARMVEVFAAVRRVLREDGTLWLNLGDSYAATSKNRTYEQATAACTLRGSPNGNASLLRQQNKIVAGMKPKDLCMMPWRVALALQADGWWLRSVICWAKKSPMPESVTDRPTSSWEPIFLMAKSERYFYDAEAVKEASSTGAWDAMPPIGGVKHAGSNGNATYSGDQPANNGTRNQRNVWHLGPEPYREAHFATFPTEIPRRAIKAGTSEKGCCAACGAPWGRVVERTSMVIAPSGRDGRIEGNGQRSTSGTMVEPPSARTIGWEPGCTCGAEVVPCLVLDPFLGSGTTVAVAREMGRHGVGCELNPEYAALARERIGKAERPATFRSDREIDSPLFTESNP